MIPPPLNLFAAAAAPSQETFETLWETSVVKVERILSHAQASPPGFWYDQPREEWVALLRGQAALEFESPRQTLPLTAGDSLLIPAHCRHRVAHTSADALWLAVHLK